MCSNLDIAPNFIFFGMCLSGTFSEGVQGLFNRPAGIKFPTPILSGSMKYLAARLKWADWWMRIFQHNVQNGIAKTVEPGVRIFRAIVPTTLPMDLCRRVALKKISK